MKKTGLDALTILYQLIADSALKTAISGGVYKLKRPLGSQLEDIVLNALPFNADQVQIGTINANLYVPNLKEKIGGKEQEVADLARMQELVNLATSLFAEHYDASYDFWLVNVATLEEEETGQFYTNLRIDFKFFPTD
ncbi:MULTISPECIES: hypothetical protein [unclassified Spirosoma]|uniref:hypothetical protein n=1 Tax=unclassified Spirosoma TaxID=2621999 RepID=UPI0009593604|nr:MULTISPECIES: hypothetical protein [unclassified Spirosoma]MBN8821274.1 hypothetical protein [Spirosoma sp.]OJW78063.1 MAG: hypothetical protein BGO59_29025 [Spirosoma sp. 48-14]